MAQPKRFQLAHAPQSTDEIRERYPLFYRLLIDRQNEILGRTDTARQHLDEQVMESPGDAADESVIDTSADYFLRLANNHQQELLEIHDALDRMRRGVYGMCEECENPISVERLKHLPTARLCIDDQAALEKREMAQRLRILPKL